MTAAIKIHGATYADRRGVLKRLSQLNKENKEFGLSDGRVTEALMIEEYLSSTSTAETASKRYYGLTLVPGFGRPGASHFVNSYGEALCGRWLGQAFYTNVESDRATCGTCCKAADAAKRDGFANTGGSAARRSL